MTLRVGRRKSALVGVLLAVLGLPIRARAAAFFSQFGVDPPILSIGEGAEFVLGGVSTPGVVVPELSFHLHLFFNEGRATGPPEVMFSQGDVLRFTMGGTSIVYEFDDGANILEPALGASGFFDGSDIDDNFASADPIGLAFAAADVNGETFTLEVLAGDGVRFSGLEFSDTVAGTFQMGGASTLVRREYDVRSGETVVVDFDGLVAGDVVQDQFHDRGLTFLGDTILDEQLLIDRRGVGLDRLEARVLFNQSATPPLGLRGFIGIRFARPAFSLRFDFAGPDPVLAGGFADDITETSLLFFQSVSPAPGPSGLLEGSVALSYSSGFDALLIAPSKASATKGLFIDNLSVTFLRVASIDFEGMSEGKELTGQLAGLGVSFFGDSILDERGLIEQGGVGYESLEGGMLLNASATPPLGQDGFLGMRFDELASSVSFDYSGPSPLRVFFFRGDFSAQNVVAERQFFTTVSSTGFPEGKVSFTDPAGFDGLVVADYGSVVIDNLVVIYSR